MDDLEVPQFQEHSIYSDGIRPKGSTRLSSPILNHHRFAGAGGCLQAFAGPGACCCQWASEDQGVEGGQVGCCLDIGNLTTCGQSCCRWCVRTVETHGFRVRFPFDCLSGPQWNFYNIYNFRFIYSSQFPQKYQKTKKFVTNFNFGVPRGEGQHAI